MFDQKKFEPEKNFRSEEILGPKLFVVVVLLVTWAPNPLKSA